MTEAETTTEEKAVIEAVAGEKSIAEKVQTGLEQEIENASPESSEIEEAVLEESMIEDTGFSIAEYAKRFYHRYIKEKTFRKNVHHYLELSGYQKLTLTLGRIFFKSWYEKKTHSLIDDYSTKIKEDLEIAYLVQEEREQQKMMEELLEQDAEEIKEIEAATEEAETELEKTLREEEERKRKTESEFAAKLDDVEEERDSRLAKIEEETDVEEIVKEKLGEAVAGLKIVCKDGDGELTFDEERVVQKLEERFLSEIIEGIEHEDGVGFMAKVRETYDGIVAYWAEMEDLSELPNVDWVQSVINSRMHGYRLPQYPFFIAGKYEGRGKSSIDTAIALDTSSSMRHNNRFTAAQKTTLATHALMRKLNPQNETFLAEYNDGLFPITTADLMKTVKPRFWTRTDLALEWLYDTLAGRGPAFAYLVTDGYPEGQNNIITRCMEAANAFQSNPCLMLRIFLIDGNSETRNIIRKIGKAAGPETRVIPVDNYELGGKMIRDISQSIGEMYYVNEF